MYYPSALWTAARYRLQVLYVICNNGGYMAMKDNYRLLGATSKPELLWKLTSEFQGIDYVGLAESLGVSGRRVQTPAELEPAIRAAADIDGPTVLDVLLDPMDAGFHRPRLR